MAFCRPLQLHARSLCKSVYRASKLVAVLYAADRNVLRHVDWAGYNRLAMVIYEQQDQEYIGRNRRLDGIPFYVGVTVFLNPYAFLDLDRHSCREQ
jgi:hypothetical protein